MIPGEHQTGEANATRLNRSIERHDARPRTMFFLAELGTGVLWLCRGSVLSLRHITPPIQCTINTRSCVSY